jgi:iron complex transport system substrate-binding protein
MDDGARHGPPCYRFIFKVDDTDSACVFAQKVVYLYRAVPLWVAMMLVVRIDRPCCCWTPPFLKVRATPQRTCWKPRKPHYSFIDDICVIKPVLYNSNTQKPFEGGLMGQYRVLKEERNLMVRALLRVTVMIALSILPITEVLAYLVKDQLGREVQLPEDPGRVVSLAPSITEILFALGEGKRVAGVTQHCDFPAEARALPNVGSYVHPDLERVVALRPDLCLATRDGNPEELVIRLTSLGIPVYVVNPRDLDTAVETVLEIGRLMGAGEKALELAADMRSRIDLVKSKVTLAKHRPGVFFQIGVLPIVAVGTNTFIHELIETAGGSNLTKGPTAYPRYSREQVLALQPEVIIITSMTRGQDFEQVKQEWNRWDGLPAVRRGRVHVVDSNLFDRPTPRMVEGLEMLARLIHPELF